MWLRSAQRDQDMRLRGGSNDCGKEMSLATKSIDHDGRDDVVVGEPSINKSNGRLMQNPRKNHKLETYDDLKLDFSPEIFKSLESYLPTGVLTTSRDNKVKYMRDILLDYLPLGTQNRNHQQREYRQRILSNYKPRHREIYDIDPTTFFVPMFLKAINDNTEQSFRSIMSQPAPGIFTFEMLQPHFCELLLSKVENFEKWCNATKFRVIRPSTMNKYGVVLDDFGLQTMLDKLMKGFICPLSKVFFAEIGGSTLDSHHGFVVEYGIDKDVELGLHVDDSEEIFDYSHVPGQAVLHHGRHRHGTRAITSGHRLNLLLWCRSSIFREMTRYKKDFSGWCANCYQEKGKKLLQSVDETNLVLSKKEGKTIAQPDDKWKWEIEK